MSLPNVLGQSEPTEPAALIGRERVCSDGRSVLRSSRESIDLVNRDDVQLSGVSWNGGE